MAEQDRHQGLLKPTNEAFIVQSINELIVELAIYSSAAMSKEKGNNLLPSVSKTATRGLSDSRILCLPANDEADEVTAAMLAQVLEQSGNPAITLSAADSPLKILEEMSRHPGDIVCICALPPFALLHARTLSKRLRTKFPELRIVVGVWTLSEGGIRIQERFGKAFVDTVVVTLKQALEEILGVTSASTHSSTRPSIAADSLEFGYLDKQETELIRG
jgi:hypothetical protein